MTIVTKVECVLVFFCEGGGVGVGRGGIPYILRSKLNKFDHVRGAWAGVPNHLQMWGGRLGVDLGQFWSFKRICFYIHVWIQGYHVTCEWPIESQGRGHKGDPSVDRHLTKSITYRQLYHMRNCRSLNIKGTPTRSVSDQCKSMVTIGNGSGTDFQASPLTCINCSCRWCSVWVYHRN